MATLYPFRALRPVPEKVEQIASVPYDVISSVEARDLARGNPLSFLHIIRPEIDLPEGVNEHDPQVYKKGAENLYAYAGSKNAILEEEPSLYVYRLVMNEHEQEGIFGCVSVREYDGNTILKHEKTRPDKEDDRTRHMLAQRAHAEPVMLTYRGRDDIDSIVGETKQEPPLYNFLATDGVRHTIWRVVRTTDLVQAFRGIEKLYVADGHHRCKAASRAASELLASGESSKNDEHEYFPAVLFPMSSMQILPYNRIVRNLPLPPDEFLVRLQSVTEAVSVTDNPEPQEPGKVCLYLEGKWYAVQMPESQGESPVDYLDVSRLNEFILSPILGITDPRRDPNLDFVGGIRGTRELENLVDSGRAVLAISMYPTSIEDLVSVSDAGLLMPPKSTWFEPKLRSGLLVHLFD